MSTQTIKTNETYPHVEWIDIAGNGMASEVAVMQRNASTGDMFYIVLERLDTIDLDRLTKILKKPDAANTPLWELLFRTTLANGQNALEFFHQMVEGQNVKGKTFKPREGTQGYQTIIVDTPAVQQ